MLKVIQQTIIHFVTDNRIFQFMVNTRIIIDFNNVSLIIHHFQVYSIQTFSYEIGSFYRCIQYHTWYLIDRNRIH